MMICCACRIEMTCDKNGVGADFGGGHVYVTDRWRCAGCGATVLRTAIGAPANYDPERSFHDEYTTMASASAPSKDIKEAAAPVRPMTAGWTAEDIRETALEVFGQRLSLDWAQRILADLCNQMDDIMRAGNELVEDLIERATGWTRGGGDDEPHETVVSIKPATPKETDFDGELL